MPVSCRLTALAAALILFAAAPAGAEVIGCAGTDLIATMAPAARADLDTAVAAQPFAQGNHWRAVKGDGTIDLIGTFHLYDTRMEPVRQGLRPLIESADSLYLEATEADIARLQAELAKRPELILTQGPTLPERLPPAEWQALSQALSDRGIPPFMASKFQPWYLSTLLGIPPCAMAAMQGGPSGLDHLIMQDATAAGVPQKALEPYDTIFSIFGAFSPDEQLDMIRGSLPTIAQAEDQFATMTESYFRQDHRQIWELGRLSALAALPPADRPKFEAIFARIEDQLITRRNRNWIKVLTEAAPGHHLVVAVGAGHLSGRGGLLQLLQDQGYRLERADF